MSDEVTERDLGWLTAVLRDADELAYDNMRAAWARESIARAVLASDWYAERIAEARREGAAEALGEAIEAAHVERRRIWDEDRNEPLMLDQHWGATAGWLAWRTRAIERGDEPDWPDAMNAAILRGDDA